ncbi:NUDIX hydrolase [Nocardiopsis chromatogenes]|uniref:NUDIX hydrolase n=1 Tax=Nocardiopsis chromatogenes TaxID=280239 RepID=UPI00034C9B9D|nr:CoA pyrophosphatase [Nocardiopsis chromatogenes]
MTDVRTEQVGAPAPDWLTALAEAGARMPVPPLLRPPASGGRRAAVLILFGAGAAGPEVLLIQRNDGLRRHSGQPAFPGGSFEDGDRTPEECAVREAVEETGVDPAGIDPVGRLPELYIRHSGFRVAPVLAWWRSPSPVRAADAGEVASAAAVPVAELADPANRVRVEVAGRGAAGPGFRAGGMLVWGFTAGVVDGLLRLGGWERPWRSAATEVVTIVPPGSAIP